MTSKDLKPPPSRFASPRMAFLKTLLKSKVPRSEFASLTDTSKLKRDSATFAKFRQHLTTASQLFEDAEFPCTDKSIFFSKASPYPIQWKRPHEICDSPKFILDGAERFDICQGELGNCWLLATLASLSMHPLLMQRVVPAEQGFAPDDPAYAGIFRFQFWRFGKWIDVWVDDRLPTQNNQLVFVRSNKSNEFWSALLEKAYAKLMGSYEALIGGLMGEAMVDVSGGVVLIHELQDNTESSSSSSIDLSATLLKAQQRQALFGCNVQKNHPNPALVKSRGLELGHAYAITGVRAVTAEMVDGEVKKLLLLRMMNPWGENNGKVNANGAWNFIQPSEKLRLSLADQEDSGEFWLTLEELTETFTHLEICYIDSRMCDEIWGIPDVKWEMHTEHGEWRRHVNAGGCRNYLDTFWTNPQYKIMLKDADNDNVDNVSYLTVSLMQKSRRKTTQQQEANLLTIGYIIYQLTNQELTNFGSGLLDRRFFATHKFCASSDFVTRREVSGMHRLTPGTYVIVPCTFAPNQEGEFLLRFINDKLIDTVELDEWNLEVSDEKSALFYSDDSVDKTIHVWSGVPFSQSAVNQEEQDALYQQFRAQVGADGEIDAYELRDILDIVFKRDFPFGGFHIECVKSMVALMDLSMSGRLDYKEFKNLWLKLRILKVVFMKHDKAGRGRLNTFTLRSILKDLGFTVSNKVLNSLVIHYGDKSGEIAFNDYVACCIRLKTICEYFKAFAKRESPNQALFGYDTFLQCMMNI